MNLPERLCPPGAGSYQIRPGDTLYALSQRFGTTIQAILALNPGLDPNSLQVGRRICIPAQQFPPCPTGRYYRVQPGDVLWRISLYYGISVADLLEANPGLDPTQMSPGQLICLPAGTMPLRCPPGTRPYIIRPGDTFASIAARFRVPVAAVVQANPTANPEALRIGQRVCVPRGWARD